jgi:hypothetical protein
MVELLQNKTQRRHGADCKRIRRRSTSQSVLIAQPNANFRSSHSDNISLGRRVVFPDVHDCSVLTFVLSPFPEKDVVRNGIPGVMNADEQ